jgi:ribosomal protein S8E
LLLGLHWRRKQKGSGPEEKDRAQKRSETGRPPEQTLNEIHADQRRIVKKNCAVQWLQRRASPPEDASMIRVLREKVYEL